MPRPEVSSDAAQLALDVIEFASNGTWSELKAFLLERYDPKALERLGQELADSAGSDNPFEGEFE